ncbi:MAG: preprotein translocase subunit SecG [Clostridia bacterium]|nr:preprotein translocase subunit SecG [Clostridia bacterium]
MTPWEYILGAVLIVISIVLIILVLLQESKQQGLSGAIAGGADTFFGKNKGRTMEAKMEKITKILCTVFIILTLVTTFVVGFLAK